MQCTLQILQHIIHGLQAAFRSYGANLILTPARSARHSPLDAAVVAEARKLGGGQVVGLTPFTYENIRINEQPFIAAGTDFAEVRKTSPYWGVDGAWPAGDGQMLIGREAADHLRAFVGDVLTLTVTRHGGHQELPLKVAGILQTGSNEEGLIYLNFHDLKALTGYDRGFDVVQCSIKGSEDSRRALSHKLESSFPEVKAQLVERVAKSEGRVLSRLQSLVWIVTLVVMVLTMVCVSTTMLAAAAERRQEIGLRKALGADKLSIIRQFMAESLMLGFFGGILGTILGYCFALYVSKTVFASAVKPDLILALFTVAAAAAVTGISSYVPVYQASKTDPAVVLRGE